MTDHSQRPNEKTIEAWLEGLLPKNEAEKIEAWFEAHPEAFSDNLIPSEALKDLNKISAQNKELPELIDFLKTLPPEAPAAQHSQSWRDVLGPATRDGSLGSLGHYEVLEIIAEGGMGILFKAHDAKLDRIAAIKLLAPEFSINSTSRKRFLREARAAAKLEHQNILPIYGVYEDTVPWFSMRYIEGGSLQDALDSEQKLPDLKSLGLQLASALQAAHEAGIVHRDLKPANVLLGKNRIWLCDFGIAQTSQDPSLTMSGVLAGTPHYMSPEQAEGILLDGRSDLFSLGSVLYHCATGKPPFTGKTTTSVLQKVALADHLKPSQLNPKLPLWFERLLGNLLAKDPKNRFRNAAEVIKALESERAPRPRHRTLRKHLLLGLAAAILLPLLLLQIPPVKSATTTLLANTLERPFIVESHLFPHPTLEKAIEAASDGDTLLLPGNQPILIDTHTIPKEKSLTLRARDPDSRPLLTTKLIGSPGLRAYSPLRLQGLDFQLNTKPNGAAVIILHHDALIEDCTFRGGWELKKGMNPIKSRTVETRSAGKLTLSRCTFDVQQTNLVTIRKFSEQNNSLDLTFNHCQLGGAFAVHVANFNSPNAPLSIAFNDTRFQGNSALKVIAKNVDRTISVSATRSDFQNTGYLCWFRSKNRRGATANFQWHSNESQYVQRLAKVYLGVTPKPTKPTQLKPISEFAK